MAELADAPDLGSGSSECGFDSHPVYHLHSFNIFHMGSGIPFSAEVSGQVPGNVNRVIRQGNLQTFRQPVINLSAPVLLPYFPAHIAAAHLQYSVDPVSSAEFEEAAFIYCVEGVHIERRQGFNSVIIHRFQFFQLIWI